MTQLTLLGVSGGVGTTTLAAIAFAGTRSDRRGAPRLVAADEEALLARLASPTSGQIRSDAVIADGGRLTPEFAAAAVEHGMLAIVTAATPMGALLADQATAQLVEQAGEAALERTCVVRVGAHGRYAQAAEHPWRWSSVAHVPFDPALAQPGAVAIDRDRLASATSAGLDHWVRIALTVLG